MGRWTHPTMGHGHESTISSRPPEETCEEISRISYTLFLTSPRDNLKGLFAFFLSKPLYPLH